MSYCMRIYIEVDVEDAKYRNILDRRTFQDLQIFATLPGPTMPEDFRSKVGEKILQRLK